ncbi:hypothetical protein [Pelagibius sp. Alg239-R121]|uniref:hypothetical protein n=1 Tax=Pelagibius sp. Alg239-R121 TaxID=2993448 RepID=UPI0024A79B1A|nr:hypothetical protein [Pelagibius sp. Alg239-R121]
MESTQGAGGITDDFIRSFERRALFLRATAALILLAVAILLGVGAYVFLRAPAIADRDIEAGFDYGRRLETSLIALDEEVILLEEKRDRYIEQFGFGRRTILDVAQVETDLIEAQQSLAITEWRLQRYTEKGEGLPTGRIAHPEELGIAILHKERLASRMLFFKQFLDERLQMGIGLKTDVMVAEHAIDTATRELKTLQRHHKRALAQNEVSKDVSFVDHITGGSSSEKAQTSGASGHLIQTNITRFGTLLVVFFFIAVLQPIFRYNARLAAYYNARADALLLVRASGGRDIEKLVSILTPTVTFDKDTGAPEDQSAEMVKELIKTAAVKKS